MRILPDLRQQLAPAPVGSLPSGDEKSFAALLTPTTPASGSRAASFGELGMFGRHGAVGFPESSSAPAASHVARRSAGISEAEPIPAAPEPSAPPAEDLPGSGMISGPQAPAGPPRAVSATLQSGFTAVPEPVSPETQSTGDNERSSSASIGLPVQRKPPVRRDGGSVSLLIDEQDGALSIVARVNGGGQDEQETARRAHQVAANLSLSIAEFRLNGTAVERAFTSYVSPTGGNHGDRTD